MRYCLDMIFISDFKARSPQSFLLKRAPRRILYTQLGQNIKKIGGKAVINVYVWSWGSCMVIKNIASLNHRVTIQYVDTKNIDTLFA